MAASPFSPAVIGRDRGTRPEDAFMPARFTWTLGMLVVLASSQIQAQDDAAVLFWLTRDPASGAPGPSRLETTIDAFPGSSQSHKVYIWAKVEPSTNNAPAGDFTSIGLNLRATSPGTNNVLDLTRVELDNPLLDSTAGVNTYRHQFVVDSSQDVFTPCVLMTQCAVVAPCMNAMAGDCGLVIPPLTIPPDDFLPGFSGISIDFPFLGRRGVGIGDQARLFADPLFDGENWRIGWFEFEPLEPGTAEVFLQVGRPGIGRRGVAEPPQVHFGSASEAPVLGDEFFAESAEADAQLTIRLMPDYNRNGAVDLADYVLWRDALGTSDLRADGNGDGAVDGQDYDLWKRFFGKVDGAAEVAGNVVSIPEPRTVFLAAAAGVGLVLNGRRRKGP
jgi:hypothetical protein